MEELRLYHHVYTSIGGYKTVYASAELQAGVVAALEAFSDTLYPRVKQHSLRSLYHPSPFHICISRVFLSSADHAGRRRSCVHNIVFSKTEALELRHANPFRFPESMFLKSAPEASQVPSLAQMLPSRLELSSATPIDLTAVARTLDSPISQTVLSAVTSSHDMAVVAPAFDCYAFLAATGDLLPPYLRLSTAVVAGTIYRSVHTEGATVYSLTPGYDVSALTTDGVISYDTTSGRTANLPAPNRYFAYLASNMEARPGIVAKLLAVVHRYPLHRIATNDMYHHLIKAFAETEQCFGDDGSVDAMADVNAILRQLVSFFQAGYSSIVLESLRQAFQDLEGKGELSASEDILRQLEASLDDRLVQPVQKEAAIARLANWLSRAYSPLQAGPSA
jgi:hypothetical protein